MNLTALIAELFVGGVLCASWILMFLMSIFGAQNIINFFEKNSFGGTLLFTVFAYTLGVVFDRVWDKVTKKIDDRIEKKYYTSKEDLHRARREIFGKEKYGADFINYIRSRMRIARASLCNFTLITVFGLLLYFVEKEKVKMIDIFTIVIPGVALISASCYALFNILNTYYKSLKLFVHENINIEQVDEANLHSPPPS